MIIKVITPIDEKTFVVTVSTGQSGSFNINSLIFPGGTLEYQGKSYTIDSIEAVEPLKSYKITVE
jgi:hypothetical protein